MAIALLAGACAALVAGCGSSTKTVSVAAAPPTQTSGATASSTTSAPKPAAGGGASGAATAPGTTRTAPAPAFTHEGAGASGQSSGGQQLSAALALVRAKGFTASDSSQYHPDQTLRVLIGTRTGSGDGYGQQAFFFVDGSYIGTDSSQPSATLKIADQSDTEVTLAYPLYRKSDSLCCPSGGQAKVSFQLDNGRLVPLSSIPSASSQAALSRQ